MSDPFHLYFYRNPSNLDHSYRRKRQALPPPDPPRDLEVVSVTEDSAQLSWEPHDSSEVQVNYRVEIKPENSQK